jgi:hypothetical protein
VTGNPGDPDLPNSAPAPQLAPIPPPSAASDAVGVLPATFRVRWQGRAMGRGARLGGGVGVIVDRGTVVRVELDPTVGHEQRGTRPCVAVSDPAVNADQRFPLIAFDELP